MLKNYFDQLRELFDDYDFDNHPEAIYNMDETGVPLEPRPPKTLDLTLEHFNNKNTPKDNLSKTERTTLNKLKETKRHHNQKGQQRGHHRSRDHRKIHRRWTQTSKQPNSLPTQQ